MDYKNHPVREEERIEQRGVVVVEVGSMPSGERPFQTETMVIGLCLAGFATFDYDMQSKKFVPNDIGVTLPNHLFTYCTTSSDYKALLIIVSKPFYDRLIHHESFMDYRKYYYKPACHVTDEQFEKVMDIVRVIRLVSDLNHPKRTETLENLLDLFFYALTRCRGEEGKKSDTETRNEQLFSSFYDLLIANYQEHHDLAWYAGKLSLSPKYFSNLIRQTTEKSAMEWINIVLVMQAKKLLRTRRDMTVQQVAYELGFNENASFCRFFHRETGLRPKEYREG
ncbi:MAG: AraC family transcriptional regulator [Paludibacteraceae bacterium]|nr:AraC family transcriptional regulator [Paludibacteraceae bacterium]